MVMQTLKLCDIVTVERVSGRSGIQTHTDNADIPDDKHNLAYRAAALLAEEFHIEDGIDITIEKKIPAEAGLAGGSTDAAAVLRAVNEVFGLGLTAEELMERGVRLGADVPYCIVGGTKLAEGIGGYGIVCLRLVENSLKVMIVDHNRRCVERFKGNALVVDVDRHRTVIHLLDFAFIEKFLLK
jgi:4-diphosphocytidyl-2C-methyl-D-erythritol kinase